MNRAATCIQRWWRGFILRHRWNYLKGEVCSLLKISSFSQLINQVNKNGFTWFEFSARYRGVIKRMQKMRISEYRQFIFNLDQARDFLVFEKSFLHLFPSIVFLVLL